MLLGLPTLGFMEAVKRARVYNGPINHRTTKILHYFPYWRVPSQAEN